MKHIHNVIIIIQVLLIIIGASGVLLGLGTAVASDNEIITESQMIKQAIISIAMTVGAMFGVYGLEIIDKKIK